MFYKSVIKTTNQICGIQHLNFGFFTKYLHISFPPKVCIYKCLPSSKTPILGQSPNHHQHEQQNQTQQEFKIQTFKCPMAYSYP
jgi:hypothetical protein